MLSCVLRNAYLYDTPTRSFVAGDLSINDGIITARTEPGQTAARSAAQAAESAVAVYDMAGSRVIPGLVDVHTHGRAGGDFNTADAPLLDRMAAAYLAAGVTTVLPTLASATPEDLLAAIGRLNALGERAAEDPHLPHIPGVHLEGRYLHPDKRGAHAQALLHAPDPAEVADLLGAVAGVRHITAALELDTDGAFLRRALSLGATMALGHTQADYETATRLLGQGVTAMTHLFNAMPPLHHRDGGAVAAGLLHDTCFCELICDGYHVAPHMVRLAASLAGERLVLVSDSMEATGCPDGDYAIAGLPVTVRDGQARTANGTLAGSTLSLWQAVENLAAFAEIPLEQAIYAATMAPACEVGINHTVGSLSPGKRADLVVLDDHDQPCRVMCGGAWAE